MAYAVSAIMDETTNSSHLNRFDIKSVACASRIVHLIYIFSVEMARTRRKKEETEGEEAPEDPVATKEPSAEDAPGEEAEPEDGNDAEDELQGEKEEAAKEEAKEEEASPTDAQKQSDAAATSAAAAAAAAIAARLVNKHEEQQNNGSKRAREGDESDERDTKRTFDGPAADNTGGAPESQQPEGSVTESLMVPATLVGKLIGRGGETIRQLQQSTATNIQIDHASQGPERKITITGSNAESVAKAKSAILTVDSSDSSKTVECPQSLVGKIIGRGGETIRALQSASGARISVNQDFPPDVPREVVITGKAESVERAELMVNELIHG